MPVLKNICPMGDVELFDVGLVKAGATFEVPETRAARLLKQGNFERVTDNTEKKKG